MRIEQRPVAGLIPYVNNSRKHSDEQVAQIAASIKEFGWTNPILVDGANGIIAGHGRLMAARKLGMEVVPVIELAHLSEPQRKALIIADNKLAMNAEWDNDLLMLELGELLEGGFDLDLTGFTAEEIALLENPEASEEYTRKIETPVYQPKGEKPEVSMLFNRAKTSQLSTKIRNAENISDDIKEFLLFAAERHTVFDFNKIAEFYAHSDEATQDFFEDSALVIIDFEKAIEGGFIKLSKHLANLTQAEKNA